MARHRRSTKRISRVRLKLAATDRLQLRSQMPINEKNLKSEIETRFGVRWTQTALSRSTKRISRVRLKRSRRCLHGRYFRRRSTKRISRVRLKQGPGLLPGHHACPINEKNLKSEIETTRTISDVMRRCHRSTKRISRVRLKQP